MSHRLSNVLNASALGAVLAIASMTPALAAPVGVAPQAAPMRLALSALGDLGPFRTIASDTLALVDKGDVPAARTRVKDLETAWDKAEATLKRKDKATWTTLDGMIDAALTELRTPNPKPAACAASLKALVAQMDMVDKA